jgi:molecular chaperone Hsp33
VQTLPQAHGTALVELVRQTLHGPIFSRLLAAAFDSNRVEPEYIARSALGDCANGMQILDTRKVEFYCPCSRQRAESTMQMLRQEDLKEMLLEDNFAQVTCNFCGKAYRFSQIELERIRRRHDKELGRA